MHKKFIVKDQLQIWDMLIRIAGSQKELAGVLHINQSLLNKYLYVGINEEEHRRRSPLEFVRDVGRYLKSVRYDAKDCEDKELKVLCEDAMNSIGQYCASAMGGVFVPHSKLKAMEAFAEAYRKHIKELKH